MTKNTLPTYAIVELLIRLSHINPLIGDYNGHLAYEDGVVVKTTAGTIVFPNALIGQQFNHPDLITEAELKALAALFASHK